MSYKELPLDALIGQLSAGWQPDRCGAPQELVRRWASAVGAATKIRKTETNVLFFMADLCGFCLRGMDNIACFVLGGNSDIIPVTRELWARVSHLLAFVFALPDSSYRQAKEVFPESRTLLLSADEMKQLLGDGDPKQFLKTLLWKHIPRRRLIPYNFLLPAEGSMFFGRRRELDRLLGEDQVSFAIAGPSRVGKTSLVKRYIREMSQLKDPLAPSTFYINFYDCEDHSPNGTAKFCAMKIDSSSRSARMTVPDLVNFLRYKSATLGSPLNLILDEVDEVCQGNAFRSLASAARAGYCRLVLCGRGVLLKTMLDVKSPLESHLDLIQPEPLDDGSARQLVLLPLTDLGLQIQGSEKLVSEVLRLTGRLPHLLHLYGYKLVELALADGDDVVSIKHVETLKWDFVVAQYFISPLRELKDPEARLIGLSLLRAKPGDFSIQFVQKLASRAGLYLDYARATQICNELVINNVLVWHNGAFRVANEGLYFYADEMKFVEGALGEAASEIKGLS
jgi:hypothetical protein